MGGWVILALIVLLVINNLSKKYKIYNSKGELETITNDTEVKCKCWDLKEFDKWLNKLVMKNGSTEY